MRTRFPTIAVTATLAATTVLTSSTALARITDAPDPPHTPAVAESQAGQAPSAPGVFQPRPIKWKKCGEEVLDELGARCGYLVVPLDHDKPKGKKIRLAVSRIEHSSKKADYQGPLVINPGGPGGPGREEVFQSLLMPTKVSSAYDWIGLDTRGVGASKPALTCDGNYNGYDRPQYVPTTAKGEKIWLQRAARYAQKCAQAGGPLLNNLRTTDNVKDLEILRKALGQNKISLLGYSYGTYLGQVYATQYPDRVHRMVLDGVVDPGKSLYVSNMDQDRGFDDNIGAFFAWVAEEHSTYRLGTTAAAVEKEYYKQLGALDRKAAGGQIGGDEWTDVFESAAYSALAWEETAELFAGWVHKSNWKPLKAAYDEASPQGPGQDNGYAMYLATTCTDAKWPRKWSRIKSDNRALHAKAPFMTWSNAWFNAPCATWAGQSEEMARVDGSKAPPILLLSETYDAPTPLTGAFEARRRFPRSALVEGVGGRSHATSLLGSACTRTAVERYLSTGNLPKRVTGRTSDKQCAPALQP